MIQNEVLEKNIRRLNYSFYYQVQRIVYIYE